MKIGHIFNEKINDKDNILDLTPQEFDIEYVTNIIDNNKNTTKPTDETKYQDAENNFAKKYYGSLLPVDDKEKDLISKYDDDKIDGLIKELGEDILLISGDFWGIQKFIFDGLTSDKASKILRSRSAMVQLITYIVVDIIKKEFENSDSVLFGAGKFLILAKATDSESDNKKIEDIQKELDSYFLKNFFGQNGFILSTALTTATKLKNQHSDEMKKDLESLGKNNDKKKFNKFDLLNINDSDICIDIFKNSNSDEQVCKFCSKRVKELVIDDDNEKACKICYNQIKLGEYLTKKSYLKVYKDNNLAKKDDILILEYKDLKYYGKFYTKESNLFDCDKREITTIYDISKDKYSGFPKWSLGSFVAKDELDRIKTFEEMAKDSSGLMALKADVDKLGDTFREFYMQNFKKFNRLSRELDFFFSDYATNLIETKYKNLYVVFAGGDDLFLVGEYREVIEFAKEIREQFFKFSLEKATLSIGLVMFKPSTPITYVSHLADGAEARAKGVLEDKSKPEDKNKNPSRNGIDIFGIPMKFEEFSYIEEEFTKVIEFLKNNKVETSSLYYRLIELCDMRANLNQDIRNGMWRSKISYLFKRNVDSKSIDSSEIVFELVDLIEKYGEKVKPSIFLKIYNNRDKKINKEI